MTDLELGLIATLGVIVFGYTGFYFGKWIQRKRDGRSMVHTMSADQLRDALKVRTNLTLDPTKRKSLQPTNQKPVPPGWEEVQIKAGVEKRQRSASASVRADKSLQVRNDGSFKHIFFGSQLSVGDKVLIRGLSKSRHTFEISGNQAYIDNKPHPLNEGELERIKNLILKHR